MSERHAPADQQHSAEPSDCCTQGSAGGASPASVILLVALGSLLLVKWRDGSLPLYVHPSSIPILTLTGFGLLALAAVQLWRLARRALHDSQHDADQAPGNVGLTWSLGLVALAVVVGMLLPARPLGSAAAANQSAAVAPQPLQPLTDETEGWTLLEWVQAVSGGVQRERYVGRPVSVVGFVYRPREGPAAGETRVARFVVRCCAADGFAVSLPVRSPVADALQPDTWVHVEGVLRLDEGGSRLTPYVDANRLTIVAAPAVPYLAPS